MASDMLCYPGGTDLYERTGPGPSTAVSSEWFVWGRTNSLARGALRD